MTCDDCGKEITNKYVVYGDSYELCKECAEKAKVEIIELMGELSGRVRKELNK